MKQGNAIKALAVLHKAMLAGQIVFAAVCIFLVYAKITEPPFKQYDRELQLVALALAAVALFGGNTVFKKKITSAKYLQTGIKAQFDMYRQASFLLWILIEGPFVFITIGFFLTGNYAFLLLALVLTGSFAMMAPSAAKSALYLGANEDNVNKL